MLAVADPGSERGLICATMLGLVGRRGCAELALADLERAAGITAHEFHAHFASLEDCFEAIWTEIDAELRRRMHAAYQAEEEWRAGLRGALAAAVELFVADPPAARLYLVEASAVQPLRRTRSLEALAEMLDRAPRRDDLPFADPRLLAEALAGGVWSTAAGLVRDGGVVALEAALGELTYLCVLPFCGREAAEEELRRS